MKFLKILLNAYKYEESQNNINYNVIQNLKNFEEVFGLNKIKIYEKVYKEGKKYIAFLQNIRKSIGKLIYLRIILRYLIIILLQ